MAYQRPGPQADAPVRRAQPSPPDTARDETAAPAPGRAARARHAAWVTFEALVALLLFVGALQVMKEGAGQLDLLHRGTWLVRNAGSTLGLGWIGAMIVLSGAPIAASALTLVAAGTISTAQGFTMVTGSRLGAAFIVLLVAVVYALRGGEGKRMAPVSTALIALLAAAAIYVPGTLLGLGLLAWPPFHHIHLMFPASFGNLLDLVYGPVLDAVASWPGWLLFCGGLGLIVVSFKLFDALVPDIDERDLAGSRLAWVRRKWPMFGLGIVFTLATMSVSVAVTALVPLVAKGYLKRDEILPYIIGANIGTLGDKLVIAFLVHSAAAVLIMVAEIVSMTAVGLALMAFAYRPLRSGIWRFQRQMLRSRTRLAMFTVGLFVLPATIVAISNLFG